MWKKLPWTLLEVIIIVQLNPVYVYCESKDNENREWFQWRGPNRDGVSLEKGFINTWSSSIPTTLWRSRVGKGFSGVSIAQDRAFTLSMWENLEYAICMDLEDGSELWHFNLGETFPEHQGGSGPRSTVTVTDSQVFALSSRGKLYALKADSGEKLWGRDLIEDFNSKIPRWGFCQSPLIDDDLLIIEGGIQTENAIADTLANPNSTGSLIALQKDNGNIVWVIPIANPGFYSSPIAITLHDIRQIVVFTAKGLVAVSPDNGLRLWAYKWETNFNVNVATPVFIPPDRIFISSGYDKGATVIQIQKNNDQMVVQEIWRNRVMKNHFSSSVLHEDYLYGFDQATLKCIEADTGLEKWRHRGFGKGSLILADRHLIILGERGRLALVEAEPSQYREIASTQVLKGQKSWTSPALFNGKLYLRDEQEIVCLDIQE